MRKTSQNHIRNIGIIAHVDAGKTTTAERVLYYTGKNYRMGNTYEGNTTLDYDMQERQRGITINSAATTVFWHEHQINIIDTPGHIDFNIEVKRALRVLDGAIVVFDGVAGVEPQTETNWQLADEYHVPRIALINKLDRMGANYLRVADMLHERLGVTPLVLYLPIGQEDGFHGVVDLINKQALYWPSTQGVAYETGPIPVEMLEQVQHWRAKLVEQAVEQDDTLLQNWLENREPNAEALKACIRKGTLSGAFVPVLAASAYRSYGIEPLLNAVVDYLPAPNEVNHVVNSDPDAPFVALLFKVIADRHGQLSFLRLYRGRLHAGDTVLNAVTGERERVSRLYEMHADQRNELEEAQAGDIVAVMGIKNAVTGHTLSDSAEPVVLEKIVAAEPVIDIAIEARKKDDQQRLALALQALIKEDPSLHIRQDAQSGQTILSGMGELQLDVRLEDLRQRFHVEVNTGRPQVAYRETITQKVVERYLHKKQSGGPGQYAEVVLELQPLAEGEGIQFESRIVGGAVPREYIPGVEAGVRRAAQAGVLSGFPCVDLKVTLLDGSYHEQDSSVMAFEQAAVAAFQAASRKAHPVMLEPLMQVQVHMPVASLGDVIGDLSRRRAQVYAQEVQGLYGVVQANVALQEMFGYIGSLRALTSGRGNFNMQFARYAQAPASIVANLAA